jgi:hypothetical protein
MEGKPWSSSVSSVTSCSIAFRPQSREQRQVPREHATRKGDSPEHDGFTDYQDPPQVRSTVAASQQPRDCSRWDFVIGGGPGYSMLSIPLDDAQAADVAVV